MMAKGDGKLTRRQFIGYAAGVGAALAGLRALSHRAKRLRIRDHAESGLARGIAIVHGDAAAPEDEPEVVNRMTRRAVDALGGMGKLVRPRARVVIKPNMTWDRGPEMATNTNPWAVAALVEMCLEARAGGVTVIDRTISRNPGPSYEASGIAKAAAAAGADVAYVDEDRFVELPIPDGFVLKSWPFCEEFVSADECDVLINVPVLKQHGTSRLSIGMKNVFGMVGGERGKLHRQIHEKIADLNRVLKVDLTVMDAYRVLRTHGPTGGRRDDVDNSAEGARRIVAGTDPVAVDSYGASLFGYGPDEIGFVARGEEAGLGQADWHGQVVDESNV